MRNGKTRVNKTQSDLIHNAQSVQRSSVLSTFKMELLSTQNSTYVDFLPLADVSHQPGQPQQPHQGQQLGEAKDTQGPACVKDLETVTEILKQLF